MPAGGRQGASFGAPALTDACGGFWGETQPPGIWEGRPSLWPPPGPVRSYSLLPPPQHSGWTASIPELPPEGWGRHLPPDISCSPPPSWPVWSLLRPCRNPHFPWSECPFASLDSVSLPGTAVSRFLKNDPAFRHFLPLRTAPLHVGRLRLRKAHRVLWVTSFPLFLLNSSNNTLRHFVCFLQGRNKGLMG